MKKPRHKFHPTVVLLLCSSLLTISVVGAERFSVSENQIKAMGIRLGNVKEQADSLRYSYPGKVIVPPKAVQVISSPLEGVISQIFVGEYQSVKAGEAILRISSPAMSQLQLQLLQASARATLARQSYSREKALLSEGIIPIRRAQEALASLKEAEATLLQARSALALAGLFEKDINDVLRSARPSDSLVLRAVQDGIVSSLTATPGQRVDAATALLQVTQLETLWLDVQVPAEVSSGIRIGSTVTVSEKEGVTGKVVGLSPTIMASNQFVTLRAELNHTAYQLRPGELVTAEIPVESSGRTWDLRSPRSPETKMPRWSSFVLPMASKPAPSSSEVAQGNWFGSKAIFRLRTK